MKLNLVVAACSNRGIGIEGRLPWRLKGDMAFFKRITSETVDSSKMNAVIMGRKTWESIPVRFRPLANRVNVVLSSTLHAAPDGTILARSLEEALELLEDNEEPPKPVESVYIIGGSSVYQSALASPLCHRIYLTDVMREYECDTFLPKFDMTAYRSVSDDRVPRDIQTDGDVQYQFRVLERISSTVI